MENRLSFEIIMILKYNKSERMIDMSKPKTVKLHLEGLVQGVGMRYFIRQSASRYGVKGYVRNLADGSVECLMQGSASLLKDFKGHIKESSPGRIKNMKEEELIDYKKVHSSFEVTF